MKLLNRAFTTMEKVLIALLVLILVALVYYQFVDKTVRQTVANSASEAQMLEDELMAVQTRAAALRNLRNTLDELKASGKLSYMGSYNSGKQEVAFLNDLLAGTQAYSVAFSNVTRNGDQIRRSFKLTYTTGGFRAARTILERLRACDNRCLIGDVNCTIGNAGNTTVTASATFYETMAGGTPDAGLPADAAAANS